MLSEHSIPSQKRSISDENGLAVLAAAALLAISNLGEDNMGGQDAPGKKITGENLSLEKAW